MQEKKEFEQKFSKEQAALREQLQVRQSLHYRNVTWLLEAVSPFLQENRESVSQTVLNCKNYPFVATVMLRLQAKNFCAELIFLSQRFISRLLEF